MTKTFSTLLILVLSVVEAAAQPTAGGRVFIDANANGRYDRGETLLAGIPVSDGCRVVTTDAKGRYRIEVGEARKVNGQRICDVKVVYRYVGSVDDALAQERLEAYEKAI